MKLEMLPYDPEYAQDDILILDNNTGIVYQGMCCEGGEFWGFMTHEVEYFLNEASD